MNLQSHSHIFSHIERKGDRVYKKGIKQYDKFKKKIRRRKEKLGHLWKLAVWGNVKADKATNKNPEYMEVKDDPPEFKRKTGKITIQNRKGRNHNQLTNTLPEKKKRSKIHERDQKTAKKRGHTKGHQDMPTHIKSIYDGQIMEKSSN